VKEVGDGAGGGDVLGAAGEAAGGGGGEAGGAGGGGEGGGWGFGAGEATVVVAFAVLFEGLGSGGAAANTTALLTTTPGFVDFTTIVTVAVAPAVS
jgi:hypothetical protein